MWACLYHFLRFFIFVFTVKYHLDHEILLGFSFDEIHTNKLSLFNKPQLLVQSLQCILFGLVVLEYVYLWFNFIRIDLSNIDSVFYSHFSVNIQKLHEYAFTLKLPMTYGSMVLFEADVRTGHIAKNMKETRNIVYNKINRHYSLAELLSNWEILVIMAFLKSTVKINGKINHFLLPDFKVFFFFVFHREIF